MYFGCIVKVIILQLIYKNKLTKYLEDIKLLSYIIGFQCILHGNPFNILREITAEYVRFAEEVADISYSQSETFSSVSKYEDKYVLELILKYLVNL